MSEKEYRALPNEKYFSYSFIKHFDEIGPKQLVTPKVYDNKGLHYGSICHTLLLDEDSFDEKYYVSEVEKDLTATERKLYDYLITNYKITKRFLKSKKFIDVSLEAIKDLKLFKNIKDERILKNKIDNNFKDHLYESTLIGKKEIVTPSDFIDAKITANALLEHEFTSKYFKTKDSSKFEILFEIPILYKINKDNFKSLLDIILIDHEKKTIRVGDLKTGSLPNSYFKYEFFKRRYDIQACLYTKALEIYILENGLKEYTVENPIYIYTCRFTPDSPLPFEISSDILMNAYNGYTSYTNKKYTGIKDLVENIKWHRETGVYNYTKSEYENKSSLIHERDMLISNLHNHNSYYDFFNRPVRRVSEENNIDVNDIRSRFEELTRNLSDRVQFNRTSEPSDGIVRSTSTRNNSEF